MTPEEGFTEARRQCLLHARRDIESGDLATAARGRAIAKLLPPFFDWLETELKASSPDLGVIGLGQTLGMMTANLAAASTDPETLVPWLEKFRSLVVSVALDQLKHSTEEHHLEVLLP